MADDRTIFRSRSADASGNVVVETVPLPKRPIVALAIVLTVLLGAMSLAFLWPSGERSNTVRAGKISDIKRELRDTELPLYSEEGDFFIVTSESATVYASEGIAKEGLMILSARSPHLRGDRVVFCRSSRYFESFPDGSRFNLAGERIPGSPAAAGLWRHPFEVSEHGDVVVHVDRFVSQPPRGRDTLGARPAGPFCAGPPSSGGFAGGP